MFSSVSQEIIENYHKERRNKYNKVFLYFKKGNLYKINMEYPVFIGEENYNSLKYNWFFTENPIMYLDLHEKSFTDFPYTLNSAVVCLKFLCGKQIIYIPTEVEKYNKIFSAFSNTTEDPG